LLGAFIALTVALLNRRTAAGKGMPAYSLYSEERNGLGEAAYLLRQLGWVPVPLTSPVQQQFQRGLLILAEPGEDQLTDADARHLLAWVEAGNTLLLASAHRTPLHQELDLSLRGGSDDDDQVTVELAASGGYLEGIDRLTVERRATLHAPHALPLWWVEDKPGALVLRRGKGRVIAVADPALLTRRGLGRADNVLFLVNVVDRQAHEGTVYFDEYHHGLRSSGGFWGYLGYYHQHLTLLPILLAVGAAVWLTAVRLGPAVPTPRETRVDAVDYASALGRLYQQTGARRLMARTLSRGFLDALTRFLRLRRGALPAELLATWRQHDPEGKSADRLQSLLRGVGELRTSEVTDKQLLTWARAFDQFQFEVLHGR
jgi:hypothetical protein